MTPNIASSAVALVPSDTQKTLQALREVEGLHGPLCCFASSKFTLCKLIGLVQTGAHLIDFLNSPEGQRLSTRMGGRAVHVAAWGDATGHEDAKRRNFNNHVIPVFKAWAKGPNVAAFRSGSLDFVHVRNAPVAANRLLSDKIPLMVCVTAPWSNHLVVVVQGGDGQNWLIDPWDKSDDASVVSLGTGELFTRPIKVNINAGDGTIVPAPHVMFHAYFVLKDTPVRCALNI
jgi:hypothetical protein